MNNKFNKTNIVGLARIFTRFIVYYFSVERNGSLWDCGEFVLGAKTSGCSPTRCSILSSLEECLPGLQTFYLTTILHRFCSQSDVSNVFLHWHPCLFAGLP